MAHLLLLLLLDLVLRNESVQGGADGARGRFGSLAALEVTQQFLAVAAHQGPTLRVAVAGHNARSHVEPQRLVAGAPVVAARLSDRGYIAIRGVSQIEQSGLMGANGIWGWGGGWG